MLARIVRYQTVAKRMPSLARNFVLEALATSVGVTVSLIISSGVNL